MREEAWGAWFVQPGEKKAQVRCSTMCLITWKDKKGLSVSQRRLIRYRENLSQWLWPCTGQSCTEIQGNLHIWTFSEFDWMPWVTSSNFETGPDRNTGLDLMTSRRCLTSNYFLHIFSDKKLLPYPSLREPNPCLQITAIMTQILISSLHNR